MQHVKHGGKDVKAIRGGGIHAKDRVGGHGAERFHFRAALHDLGNRGGGIIGEDHLGHAAHQVGVGRKPGRIGDIEPDHRRRRGRIARLPLPAQQERAEDIEHILALIAGQGR